MTAATRKDLLVELLRELYRVAPRAYTPSHLHKLVTAQLDVELADVETLLTFMKDQGWVQSLPADDFSPTREMYWSITNFGKRIAVEKRIV